MYCVRYQLKQQMSWKLQDSRWQYVAVCHVFCSICTVVTECIAITIIHIHWSSVVYSCIYSKSLNE